MASAQLPVKPSTMLLSAFLDIALLKHQDFYIAQWFNSQMIWVVRCNEIHFGINKGQKYAKNKRYFIMRGAIPSQSNSFTIQWKVMIYLFIFLQFPYVFTLFSKALLKRTLYFWTISLVDKFKEFWQISLLEKWANLYLTFMARSHIAW